MSASNTHERIEYFECIFSPEAWESDVTPVLVTLEFPDGWQLRLDAQTDEATLTAYFGPSKRDADEDEILVHHELDGKLLDWELTPQGKVKRLHVELPLKPPIPHRLTTVIPGRWPPGKALAFQSGYVGAARLTGLVLPEQPLALHGFTQTFDGARMQARPPRP